jgi:hypothetical protein
VVLLCRAAAAGDRDSAAAAAQRRVQAPAALPGAAPVRVVDLRVQAGGKPEPELVAAR